MICGQFHLYQKEEKILYVNIRVAVRVEEELCDQY